MAQEPPRQSELRRQELEAMRADVVAHMSALPRSKRRRLRSTVEKTIAPIDEHLAELGEGDGDSPRLDAP